MEGFTSKVKNNNDLETTCSIKGSTYTTMEKFLSLDMKFNLKFLNEPSTNLLLKLLSPFF